MALVHDGFGAPLEAWAARVGVDAWTATYSIVAHEGRRFEFGDAAAEPPFVNPEGHPRYLLNLRWRYCRVNRAVFRNVVFSNCDFRGAVFERCHFKGVTFVNCLLDGATLDRCTVEGGGEVEFDFVLPSEPSTPAPATGSDEADDQNDDDASRRPTSELPDFLLTGPEARDALTDLQWYRRAVTGADSIYSPTSGVAAVPGRSSQRSGVAWQPQTSGVVMYGGRLSSLMVKDCTFVPEGGSDGSITLAFMAGSSLDFVEQGAGCVRLFYTTVRGLSVTNKVDASRRMPGETFQLLAYECVLASTFFGEGIDGTATIWSSAVLGISNASAGLDVRVEDSQQSGGDNVTFGPGTDLEHGKKLYADNCVRCHGADGAGDAAKYYPRIQAQHYEYLLRQYRWIKEGKRRNSNPEMVEQIKNFSDKDTMAVLDYVSRLKPAADMIAPKGWKNPDFK